MQVAVRRIVIVLEAHETEAVVVQNLAPPSHSKSKSIPCFFVIWKIHICDRIYSKLMSPLKFRHYAPASIYSGIQLVLPNVSRFVCVEHTFFRCVSISSFRTVTHSVSHILSKFALHLVLPILWTLVTLTPVHPSKS